MDDLDKALVALLIADARQPLATLARKLKVARTTVQSGSSGWRPPARSSATR